MKHPLIALFRRIVRLLTAHRWDKALDAGPRCHNPGKPDRSWFV